MFYRILLIFPVLFTEIKNINKHIIFKKIKNNLNN